MKDRSSGASDLAGEAYVIIRERILRGEVAIGQVISRRKVAAELGMSFLPVSEAFLRLEFEGLLESRPRAGTRVRIPTREDVRGQYLVREALEVEAARLFTEIATADERAELLKLAVRVDALRSQEEGSRFYYLNLHEKLHRRIAECTRCPALCDAIEKTRALSSTWLCVGRTINNGHPSRRHQDLMGVLIGSDKDASAAAMRDHVITSMQRALERLEPYFRARKAHTKTYSRKQFRIEVPVLEPLSANAASSE
ncbi:MAG TPA: GntR family transcriptional regulator [Bryobacteraceae bacterium]|nr:GntR family transcriptional regulator [Bryobacteraceae bacterium]